VVGREVGVAQEFSNGHERDERSSVALEFIYGRGVGRTLIGSTGVYIWPWSGTNAHR